MPALVEGSKCSWRRACAGRPEATLSDPETRSQVTTFLLPQAAAAIMGRMRVLVVEDEVALAGSIARGLEAEGFSVDVVHDGHDGFSRPWITRTQRSSSTSCCRA